MALIEEMFKGNIAAGLGRWRRNRGSAVFWTIGSMLQPTAKNMSKGLSAAKLRGKLANGD